MNLKQKCRECPRDICENLMVPAAARWKSRKLGLQERQERALASRHLTEFSDGAFLIGKQNQEIALPLATNLKSLVASLSGCELSEIFGWGGNWLNGWISTRMKEGNPIPCHVRRILKMAAIREHSWRFWSFRERRVAVKITFRVFFLLLCFYRKSIFKLKDDPDVLRINICILRDAIFI